MKILAASQVNARIHSRESPDSQNLATYNFVNYDYMTIPMTDPWCCYIWCSMDPYEYTPFMLAFFYQHHGSVMGYMT